MGFLFSKELTVTCNTWVRLYCACPACDDDTDNYWQHKGCGSSIELNSQAYTRCTSHTRPTLLISGRWECGNHVGEARETNLQKMAEAMTIAGAYYEKTANKAWARALVKSVAEQVRSN